MRCFKGRSLVSAAAVFGLFATTAIASDPKPASDTTCAVNEAVLGELPFDNIQDFEDTGRGFITPLPDNGVIKAENGDLVWDLSVYQFAKGKEVPDTVNPSL